MSSCQFEPQKAKYNDTDLGSKEFRWRVHVGVIRRHVNITVDVVLCDGFSYSFGSLNVDIFVRKVPIEPMISPLLIVGASEVISTYLVG